MRQLLEAIEIDYIDESEVLSPADDVYHIDKHQFKVPFVCGAKDLGVVTSIITPPFNICARFLFNSYCSAVLIGILLLFC